jgi:hypothetical protein
MGLKAGLFIASLSIAGAQTLTPVWVELGEHGEAFARVVVETDKDCPTARVDGVSRAFSLRTPVPAQFRPACELAIPPGAKRVTVHGQTLPLPRPNPQKIVAFGDTGCRIAGARLQDCNDPALWPFAQVAATAAAMRPQLMLDVGDYLYREDACPPEKQKECGGTPHGDNWETWNADFFRPAAKLLAAVPWVFARGNHEACNRAWRGWGYYLDTHPWTAVCQRAAPPVLVELGKFQVVLFDSSASSDNSPKDLVDTYTAQLATVRTTHGWILDHHPFWAFQGPAADGSVRAQNSGLATAFEKGSPQGIDLVLSGHTHLFEVLSFGGARPVQIVAGNGGTKLEDRPLPSFKDTEIRGFKIDGGESESVFGLTELLKDGANWKLTLRNAQGKALVGCRVAEHEVSCKDFK